MKRSILVFSLILILSLISGCSKKEEGNYIQDSTISIFPVSSMNDSLEVTLGDVMPFYDDGVMNIYHLQNSSGSNSMYYHPISRLTTTDYVHYEDKGIAINFVEEYSSPDAAIGTGSFIKDSNGLYHCFYTGHNGAADTGLPYTEVIRHATSTDQKIWTVDEEFNLYGGHNDFRDPYVYYDSNDEMYYMLVTTRVNDSGVIKRYAATNLLVDDSDWVDYGVFFYNDDGSYNMECPSYLEYNGYYYLVYSEQGENRVTHYRYRTEPNGEWKRFERDSIDASGFYAGRIEKAGNELYAFAWCANLTGGFTGDFDWGGNLVAHKLVQSSTGELNAVMIDSVKNTLSHKKTYKTINSEELTSISFAADEFKSVCFEKLNPVAQIINFKFDLNSYGGNFGVTFSVKGDNNRLGSSLIAFDTVNSTLSCYNNVSNVIRYGNPLASVNFSYDIGKTYSVSILIQGEILTVYLDNTVALTVRLPGITNKNFAFYSNGVNVTFKELNFYE